MPTKKLTNEKIPTKKRGTIAAILAKYDLLRYHEQDTITEGVSKLGLLPLASAFFPKRKPANGDKTLTANFRQHFRLFAYEQTGTYTRTKDEPPRQFTPSASQCRILADYLTNLAKDLEAAAREINRKAAKIEKEQAEKEAAQKAEQERKKQILFIAKRKNQPNQKDGFKGARERRAKAYKEKQDRIELNPFGNIVK